MDDVLSESDAVLREGTKATRLAKPAVWAILVSMAIFPLVYVGSGLGSIRHTRDEDVSNAAPVNMAENRAESSPQAEKDDDALISKIAGVWTMDYHGPRYLLINEDQTARLVSFPDMLAQMVIGCTKLEINCRWERDGKKISFHMVEGAPKKSFDYITKTWGNELPYEFVSVNDSTLVFKDLSDGDHDVWNKAAEIPEKR